MRTLSLALGFLLLYSCNKTPVRVTPEHFIGIEMDGEQVNIWEVNDWSNNTPNKIYCYYIKDGNRIKDGQETILLNRDTFIVNQYRDGIAIRSSRTTNIHD
jgi:hypothetical protein